MVRGPANAVVCETRDLGIGLPNWHAPLFEGGVFVETTVVCTHGRHANKPSKTIRKENVGCHPRRNHYYSNSWRIKPVTVT